MPIVDLWSGMARKSKVAAPRRTRKTASRRLGSCNLDRWGRCLMNMPPIPPGGLFIFDVGIVQLEEVGQLQRLAEVVFNVERIFFEHLPFVSRNGEDRNREGLRTRVRSQLSQ